MWYRNLFPGRLLLLPALSVLLTAPPRAEVVDRIAAVVNAEMITLSDLEWLIRYQNLPVPDDPEKRREFLLGVLQQLIDQKLIAAEAQRTPGIQVTAEQIQNRVEAFRARFPSEEAFRKRLEEMEMSSEDLRELYRRQLFVLAFVKVRFEPFIIVVPDQIEEYYRGELVPRFRENDQEPPPMELVEEQIREILTVERTNEEMDSWVRNERRKARIQVLLFRQPERTPNLPENFRKAPELRPLSPGNP